MKRKALLAGLLSVSLAFSSVVVPAGADSALGKLTGIERKVVYAADEAKITVVGMDSEYINLDGDNFNVKEDEYPESGFELPVTSDGITIDKSKLLEGVEYTLSISIYNNIYDPEICRFVTESGEETTNFIFKMEKGQLKEIDRDSKKTSSKPLTKIIVRKNHDKNDVKLPSFDVVYEDGSRVEDGVLINISGNGNGTKLPVINGKIASDLTIKSNTLTQIGFANATVNSKLAKVKESVYGDETTVDVFVDDSGKAYIMQSLYDYTNTSTKFTKITLIKKTAAPLYVGPVVVGGTQPGAGGAQSGEELKDIADDKTALGGASGSAVKGKRIAAGKDVKVADIEVVFEDGTKVPNGVVLDNFRMKDIFAEPAHYKVKDGKISGIVLKADEQYKLGFDVTNADYNNYEVVGAYKSKKLLRVYARYDGAALLKYDYDEGIEAPEEFISKIVVKKTDGKPSEPVKSTSCLMNLILSDSGFQPEGKLPFRLVRKDNNKSKLVYSSDDGILTLVGEADVDYEIKLDKNPVYKLKDKVEFSFVLDSFGKYQPMVKGYKNVDNLEERLSCRYIDLVRLDGKVPVGSTLDSGECTACQKYSLKDYKIIYNTKRAAVKAIPVQFKSAAFKKQFKFEVYNATKQKVEKIVLSKNGKLSGLKLVKGNDYIISALDKEYSMKNAYVTLSNDGKKLVTSKAPYGDFKGFKLTKRDKALTDEKLANRIDYKLPVYVLGNNEKKVNNVTLKFYSTRETIEAKVVDGWVDLSLLEDTNYVMEVVKGNYAIDAFPMTVKDKSEYNAKKYVFNHLSCGSVQALYLINKKQAHKNDTTLVSGDGTTKVTGFRFGNGEYALSSRVLKDVKVPELKGKKYLVLDVDTVNMYRVELSPLAHGNFKVTTTVAGKKPVKNVYYIDDANKLHKVKFTQKGDKLTFNMNSMGRYNTVIEYK